jgi:hypothetical protein
VWERDRCCPPCPLASPRTMVVGCRVAGRCLNSRVGRQAPRSGLRLHPPMQHSHPGQHSVATRSPAVAAAAAAVMRWRPRSAMQRPKVDRRHPRHLCQPFVLGLAGGIVGQRLADLAHLEVRVRGT